MVCEEHKREIREEEEEELRRESMPDKTFEVVVLQRHYATVTAKTEEEAREKIMGLAADDEGVEWDEQVFDWQSPDIESVEELE